VENQNGCSDTVYATQIVRGEHAFYMPNSFTPNGDGLNDMFYPVGDKISIDGYSFKIFNRWGELIFKTDMFGEDYGWDGKLINENAPSDSYIWRVDLIDSSSGEEKSFQGYVLLTR
jgi:gliding motility-associated-like protein